MKTETATVGTSREVLAPYYLHKLEIEVRYADDDIVRGILHNLSTSGRYITIQFDSEQHVGGKETELVQLSMCLPVLRPFSALTTALEDGTVPACVLAALCLGEEVDLEDPEAFLWTADEEDPEDQPWVEVTGEDAFTADGLSFSIYPDWTWYGNGLNENCAPAAAIDYLRSKGFALPVNGRPLVEGVDFIAKSAAATPIQEGRESQQA